jgi:hypothetical protein
MDKERVMDLLAELAHRAVGLEAAIYESRGILGEYYSEEGHLSHPPETCPVCGNALLKRDVYGSINVLCLACDYRDSW